MRRMAQAVIDDFDELLEALAREQGRPRAEIATLELLAAIDALIWIADDGADVLGGRRVGVHRSMSLAKRARIAYEPYGVVGVIGAGSAPFAQPLGQIAGALLAGNGVAFKPAARAASGGRADRPGAGARRACPRGSCAIVHGGAEAGVALARAPVDKILFTGSPAVGREVARACVSREKEVTVELGGKDAMLVLADAHLAARRRRRAVGGLRRRRPGARLGRARLRRPRGATSVSSPRSSRAPRALRVGDPADPRMQVGPLASARRAEHVHELVADAVAQGAQLRLRRPRAAGRVRAGAVLRAGRDHRRDARRCA